MIEVKSRGKNWLPLPMPLAIKLPEITVSDEDFFPKGEVVKYYKNIHIGVLKNSQGKDLEFDLSEIELVGPKASSAYIKEGTRVGYDVSHTSNGIKVTMLKIY